MSFADVLALLAVALGLVAALVFVVILAVQSAVRRLDGGGE